MMSKSIPVYRHGRKFYVSGEEYEILRSEERRQRHTAKLKSQHLPVPQLYQTPARSASTSLYNPLQRSYSNPFDYRYGVLRTPHLPANSLINTSQRHGSHRPSRQAFRKYDAQDDLSSITSHMITKTRSPNTRSNSSDKVLDLRRTPLLSDTENDIKRAFSAEMSQLLSAPSQQKSKQRSSILSHRPVPTTVSDYGVSPITTFSMTPNDQTHTHTSGSKLTKYLAGIKPSSLNPSSKSSASALSGTGSLFESGMQGSDHVYTVLGSSNRRTGTSASSLLANSSFENTHKDYHQGDTASGTSLSDENSLSSLIQRRNTELIRSRRQDYNSELEDDSNQQRELWTRSTVRSQSSDGLLEKKRVRFADMEGLTLETISNGDQLNSPVHNRLLHRPHHVKVSNDFRGLPRPFHSTLYQTTAKVNENKLATDV